MRRVAFVWHLHQPDYRDPHTGVPRMPWVRLHALRGYRDMVVETLEGHLPWTLNVVPSLLDQLDHYAAGGSDPHLDLTATPAAELDAASIGAIRDTFVCGHPAMRAAHPAWRALGEHLSSGARLTVDDLRDAQVWSTLAWFGATALRDFPELGRWQRKGRGFSAADLSDMLAVQQQIVRALPRQIMSLPQEVLSVSAYYHPILPLLVDARSAHRSQPHLPNDVDFRWPGDALQQLVAARARLGGGGGPLGLWPSEGALSPEVVELAARAGFRWLCSDERVLAASERVGHGVGGWDLGHGMRGFFRDTELSDAIGFRVASVDPERAAADWVSALRSREGSVLVALDGENPWESFADAGAGFRAALWRALRGIQVDPVDAWLDEPPVGRVTRLHTGSWINANLAIWAGHHEDRRAWRALAAAREVVAAAGDPPEALQHLYAAEGSDWFWWYGEEFHTPFARTFDELFRAHLQAAWTAVGQRAPDELSLTLLDPDPVTIEPPTRWLSGPIDGSWLSEVGSGRVGLPQGAMARGRAPALRFGWSRPGPVLHIAVAGGEHHLVIDGVDVRSSVWSGGPVATVQVVGPEGPAFGSSIVLEPPSEDPWWTD
jgi:alpha-amylase/alpha-mannosidase (GH57 family)